MAKIKKQSVKRLQDDLQRIARAHFAYVGAYFGAIIILYAWNTITNEAVGRRWTLAGTLLAINVVVWFISHMGQPSRKRLVMLTLALAIADMIFAGVNVYWDRGMASIFAILFIIPLLTVAILRSRLIMISAATIASAVYSIATVQYFTNNYGEGYKVQLWGVIFLFSALFFVVAWQLYTIFRSDD